ncbi:MAG: metal ABC transporter permease [Clostridiales bacterium]|jgi:zinc transport system permease protein|nr:metal ABC transporter permease [Clostridiales bacterium]MCI2162043.1 metal ABC transporter permease [Oscillospiraceae bacterium]MCI1962460.1 metal ABC transporter permease [Clostridiales bacterium]MCI2022728.1 metal ABC transporter permease [Clostridiales bacterium]MCI2026957.1 metal ABC transporter permease [Clostridiales bacterium]
MEWFYRLVDTLLPFQWTEFGYMKNALLAIILITPLFGLVGTMIVNNKMAFFSDALGHSALTGIAIGVMLGIDNYLISMMGFALLFALGISAVMRKASSSADTIIGVFASTGLALGVVLLSAAGGFAKYSSYLIGDILTVQPEEIGMLGILLLVILIAWVLFFNPFLLTSVNGDLAASKNIPVGVIQQVFMMIVAVLVTVSIKWIGVLIINSLLVLPAAAARNVARSMRSYHGLSVIFSVVSGISGLIISYYAGTAAGGTIVLVAAVIFFVSFFLGRRRMHVSA